MFMFYQIELYRSNSFSLQRSIAHLVIIYLLKYLSYGPGFKPLGARKFTNNHMVIKTYYMKFRVRYVSLDHIEGN